MIHRREFLSAAVVLCTMHRPQPQTGPGSALVPVGTGWARNQINAVIFRRNALTSHGRRQYIAFYDADGRVVLGARRLGQSAWSLHQTSLSGDVRDAHNAICIAIDGRGVLHMAWNHHGSTLQYCRARRPGSLELTDRLTMIGERESRVTYPEFYGMPNGDLLFLYRDGASGDGRLVINRFDATTQVWTRLHDDLVSGEGKRSAYWQAAVDARGGVHLSWVWRETPDVRTNHDLAYARSRDGGKTWTNSSGDPYELPITQASAEYAARIPPESDLINQTSMCLDADLRPVIAGYWRPPGTSAPQYHVVFRDPATWKTKQITQRTQPFSLGGRGTQRIPISRPLVLSARRRSRSYVLVVYRDAERGNVVTLARSDDPAREQWHHRDLTGFPVDFWEPACDLASWERDRVLHLFVQRVGQGADESLESVPPQRVYVLECDPFAD